MIAEGALVLAAIYILTLLHSRRKLKRDNSQLMAATELLMAKLDQIQMEKDAKKAKELKEMRAKLAPPPSAFKKGSDEEILRKLIAAMDLQCDDQGMFNVTAIVDDQNKLDKVIETMEEGDGED
jgi:hypothetical protein